MDYSSELRAGPGCRWLRARNLNVLTPLRQKRQPSCYGPTNHLARVHATGTPCTRVVRPDIWQHIWGVGRVCSGKRGNFNAQLVYILCIFSFEQTLLLHWTSLCVSRNSIAASDTKINGDQNRFLWKSILKLTNLKGGIFGRQRA